MALNVSFANHVGDSLRQAGYAVRRWRHGVMGTQVYERNGRAIVVIPSIELPPPVIQPISQSVSDYFKRLCDVLSGLGKKFNVSDLFLPGGGDVPVPEWFKDWCKKNGIRIHIIDSDSSVLLQIDITG
jgi:hypothetical protein